MKRKKDDILGYMGYKKTIWREATFAMARKDIFMDGGDKAYSKGEIYNVTKFELLHVNIKDNQLRENHGISKGLLLRQFIPLKKMA